MANGLTRAININVTQNKRSNIIEDIFGTPAERAQQQQIKAAEDVKQEQRIIKQKESDYKLFMQFEKNFDNLSDKRKIAEQMGLTELVAGMEAKYDFATIESEEKIMQDISTTSGAQELVETFNKIRPDSYYSDKARTLAESKMKSFGNIIPSAVTEKYNQDLLMYNTNSRLLQNYKQLQVDFKSNYKDFTEEELRAIEPQIMGKGDAAYTAYDGGLTINVGNKELPVNITYTKLSNDINKLEAKNVELLDNQKFYETNFKNQFDYALSAFGPKQKETKSKEAKSKEAKSKAKKVSLLTEIDELGLGEDYIKTLENLDISALSPDVLGDNPAEKLDPIVNTLDSISGLLIDPSDYVERRYTTEEIKQLPEEVDLLIKQLDELDIDTSSNEVLMLLDSLKLSGPGVGDYDRTASLYSDGRLVDDTRRNDIDKLRKLEKRLAKVESRTRVNPKINQARQRNIQGKINKVEERLKEGNYLDEILQLLGQ
jgi:hypothetical protein